MGWKVGGGFDSVPTTESTDLGDRWSKREERLIRCTGNDDGVGHGVGEAGDEGGPLGLMLERREGLLLGAGERDASKHDE